MNPEEKDQFFLQHILQAFEKIEILVDNLDLETFLKDWKTQDAVVRNLEIIG